MRLLVLADTEPPWTSIPHAITTHHADTLITAGDLNHTWLNNAHITDAPVPTLGIYGNHDNGTYLTTLDITNLHHTPTTTNRTPLGTQHDSWERLARHEAGVPPCHHHAGTPLANTEPTTRR